MHIFIDIYVR